MDVGSELRQARERREQSLHDISETTKISTAHLRAIENNDIARLPGGIFTRGFVKAYAREVGLDPADLAQRFVTQFEEQPGASSPPETARRDAPAGGADEIAPRVPVPSVPVVVVTAMLLLAFYFVLSQPSPPEAVERDPVQLSDAVPALDPVPAVVRPGAAPGPASDVVTAAGGSGWPLHVELQFTGPCWVEAWSDGARVAYQLMRTGERLSVDARDQVVLLAGEPGSVAVSINGIRGRPLGRPGLPVTVRITADNYQDFLSP